MVTITYLLVLMWFSGILYITKWVPNYNRFSEANQIDLPFVFLNCIHLCKYVQSFLPPPVVKSHSVVVNILWLKVHFLSEQKGIITARLKAHK